MSRARPPREGPPWGSPAPLPPRARRARLGARSGARKWIHERKLLASWITLDAQRPWPAIVARGRELARVARHVEMIHVYAGEPRILRRRRVPQPLGRILRAVQDAAPFRHINAEELARPDAEAEELAPASCVPDPVFSGVARICFLRSKLTELTGLI